MSNPSTRCPVCGGDGEVVTYSASKRKVKCAQCGGSGVVEAPSAPMNNPQRPTDAGCVEQYDLDAATPWLSADPTQVTASNPLVQAFARHRLAALSASGGDAAELAAAGRTELVECLIQAIRDEQARCDGFDHMLDAKECIDVIRETIAAIDALPLAKQEQS